jgi:hypothetical protein
MLRAEAFTELYLGLGRRTRRRRSADLSAGAEMLALGYWTLEPTSE